MGIITLENVRATSDITVKVRLKDGGVYIDWSTLTDIKAYIFSDAQRAMAGRCAVDVDENDGTLLVCEYSANKPQYLGVNRIVVQGKYRGRMKTYDKAAFNVVSRTHDSAGDVVLDDPVVDLDLEVADVSSSILDTAILAAIGAADRANEAAEAAEHMVDIHTGPAGADGTDGTDGTDGKSAYEIAVDEGFVGTEEQWLASLKGEQGNTGSSVDYPYELVNNCTTNDATKGLSAAQGKVLKDELTQLEAEKADKDMVRAYMMSDRAKNALLAVLDKVAFAVPDVSDEMDELTEALFNLDEVVGVEATYTQGATVIWSDGVSSLDDLLPNLVVKAVYGDGTKVVVHNFILSGSLTAGTSTITVTYLGEFIDTFDVTVTAYGSKTTYTMAEGSILNKPGRLSAYTYGGNENTPGVANYELSTETTRRVFVTNFGKQKVRDSATDNVIDCYPIKIPKDAVSVTVTVSGSNQQIACRVWYLLENGHFTDRNFNGSEIYPYKSVNYATGSNTLDISAITGRDDTFLFVWGQRVSGASYSGNEPTAITVTFSNS